VEVLVVHDRKTMRDEIVKILNEEKDTGCNVSQAADIREARIALKSKTFDLMILDLTMPNNSGSDQPGYTQVAYLLREIYDHEDLNAPGDLIGISKEANSLGLLSSDLGPHFMVAVTEDDNGAWREYLIDRVRYAFRSAVSKQRSLAHHYDVDAMIVTAVDEEFQPYNNLLEFYKDRNFPDVSRFIFNDKSGNPRSGIAFSIGASGQATSASRTQSLISWFRPRIAIMSGYCGGVASKVNLGDLCFFDSAAPWDYGKWEEIRDKEGRLVSERFSSRPNALGLSGKTVRNIARELVSKNGDFTQDEMRKIHELAPTESLFPKVQLTHAASGSAVVANDRIIELIQNLNGAIKAVDMESYGFYDACLNTFVRKPQFICVKSVSDYCNGEKGDDYHSVCSYMSAVMACRILMKHIDFLE
jgi:nucleoside phosphorylase